MKSGSGKQWMVIGALVMVLLVGGGAAYWFVFSPQARAEAAAREPQPGPVHELGTIVTNLDEADRPVYIQVNIELETNGRGALAEIKRRDGAVRDAVIGILRSKGPADVQGAVGMAQVGSEIRTTLNSLLTRGEVEEVYFTQFMVQ